MVSGMTALFWASWGSPIVLGVQRQKQGDTPLWSGCSKDRARAILLKSVWLSEGPRPAWQGLAHVCLCEHTSVCAVRMHVGCTQSSLQVHVAPCVWACVQWVWTPLASMSPVLLWDQTRTVDWTSGRLGRVLGPSGPWHPEQPALHLLVPDLPERWASGARAR